MKILILTLYPAPYRVALFEKIAQVHDVTVFYEKDNDNRDPAYCQSSDRFTSYVLGCQSADDAYARALSRLRTYDLVMLFEYHTVRSGKLILRCMARRVRYAVNCDGAVTISKKFPKKQIKTLFIKHAALCLAGGDKAREYLKTYGAPDSRIVIHNFTSVYEADVIIPLSPEEKRIRRTEKNLEGDTISVSVGQMIPRKRFDLLLEIWKAIPARHHLYIIGGGSQKDALLRMIKENGLSNVHIRDFMKRDELFSFYELCDLFVFTTKEDIWGLVINEAMAKGLPVVSGDRCTAAAEMVRSGVNGYIVQEEAGKERLMEEFRSHVTELLDDAPRRSAMALSATETARNYTYEHMSHVILAAVEKTAAHGGGRKL